jgi:hypothetical protein
MDPLFGRVGGRVESPAILMFADQISCANAGIIGANVNEKIRH